MASKNRLFGLSDENEEYKGWDTPNGWLNLYLKDHLQTRNDWIFLYNQVNDIEESILLSYKGQIRAELEINGWVDDDNDLVEEYKFNREIDKARGYKVTNIIIFKDIEDLKLKNLGITKIQFGKDITDKMDEIWGIIGDRYEEFKKDQKHSK